MYTKAVGNVEFRPNLHEPGPSYSITFSLRVILYTFNDDWEIIDHILAQMEVSPPALPFRGVENRQRNHFEPYFVIISW